MQGLFPRRHVRVPAHEEIDVTGAILDFFSEQGISGVGREDVGGTAAQRVSVEFAPRACVGGDISVEC